VTLVAAIADGRTDRLEPQDNLDYLQADDEGRFEIRLLQEDPYFLEAADRSGHGRVFHLVQVAPGETTRVEIVLGPDDE
jgi:hypothetical protein